MSLSVLCYFAVLWIFPYFMEPQVLASCPDFSMLDYKVNYDNHPLFASGNYTFSRILNCASVALVRKRTIPTERPPLVGEVSANLCG
jgi:hypothetical protein